mmetsp:Transcript_22891/g.91635  ORF Transcript_22891/g.91635 Transcript_22891/m.91635 type:complete len:108 (+) Transcript_22891:1372-1695(+)
MHSCPISGHPAGNRDETDRNFLSISMISRYDDAERTLQEALGKNPNHPDTLANCIVCSMHKKKRQELVDRYKAQLETVGGEDHAWLNAEKQFRTMFDSAVASAIADV